MRRLDSHTAPVFAFSTAPGATAEDGSGDHSPFAQALLTHLGDEGLEFGSVMKLAQMEVYDGTPAHQLPYIEDALPALFLGGTQTGPFAGFRDYIAAIPAHIARHDGHYIVRGVEPTSRATGGHSVW